jgi:hypothetical protein
MGRPPIGKKAMTAAERQRRYRAGLTAKPAPTGKDREIARLKARVRDLEAQICKRAERKAKTKAKREAGASNRRGGTNVGT